MAISNTERRTQEQSGNGKTAFRILICDPIAEDGVEALRHSGADVDVRTGLSPEELRKSVDGYDALVVRSETKVTREIIEASSTMQVVGRAGASRGQRCAARHWGSSGWGRSGRRSRGGRRDSRCGC